MFGLILLGLWFGYDLVKTCLEKFQGGMASLTAAVNRSKSSLSAHYCIISIKQFTNTDNTKHTVPTLVFCYISIIQIQ
jgi:hypothetical protein